uniref:IPT/TIG domain-containing protein n=1 Tax=Streptomyces sp. NBC_00049 TaxID=2903617 RepID=A0AAU2JPZ2_9ACTN
MASALFALALLAALAGPIAWRLHRHPGFVTGRDGRLSTSTALALAWTVVLVWLLLAILAYGLTAGGGIPYFGGSDGPLSTLTTVYLPLLGGPYVALIGAKTVVGLRVESGSMAKPAPKPTVSGRRPLRELIANDSGRTDLVDLQYVALSAVTMLYVVLFFLADVGGGLPRLPAEMWALTGAPAGAYLVNKMATRANPVITDVGVRDGLLTVEGGGFTPAATGTPVLVTVDDTALPAEADPLTGTLTAALPATARPPFTVVVTARGLRSDPYRYEDPADAPAATVPAQ